MNLIDRGYRLLNRATQRAAGLSVRYLRGSTVLHDELPATLDATDVQQIVDGESTIVGRQFTWRLNKTEFAVEGVPVTPKRSDVIEWLRDGVTYRFEVLPDFGQVESGAVDPRSDWIPASAKLIERLYE